MKKLLLPIIALIAFSMNAFAGVKSNKELRGDKHFFVYSFVKAIDAYTNVNHLTVEGQRRLAISYQNLEMIIEAEEAYAKLVSLPEGVLPEDYYNYAMVLKTNRKYDQAGIWIEKFLVLKPTDLRGLDYAANKASLPNLLKDNGKFKIVHLDMNSDAEDFGPAYYKNQIVFTSSGTSPDLMKRTYNWNKKPFLNLYVSEVVDNQLQTAQVFDKSLTSNLHDGPASFSNDGNYMAFTRNKTDLKRRDRVVKLDIFFSTFKDDKWSAAEPFILNGKDYSVGHPFLTADGKTMYFTSDMPGGFGGADIYRIKKSEKGEWGKAENMGMKVNTEGDELFPFYEAKNDILFFASNGRFGLGGLDIFICELHGSKIGRVYNAGSPLNSSFDDFAIIANDKISTGYFSSNRMGGSGGDDIYAVNLNLNLSKKIEGFAKTIDGKTIPATFITLLDDKGNVIDTVTTKDDAAFTFYIDSENNFKLTGKKTDYLDGETVTNTFGKNLIVKADIILLQSEKNIEIPPVPADVIHGDVLAFHTIYFDFDQSNIRPDAEIELDIIIKYLNENPDVAIELSSYTDCRANKAYNMLLSDRRQKASAYYIKTRISKPSRVFGKGYGETNPVNACTCESEVISTCSEAEFQQNRRTEFIIVKHLKK